MRPGRLLFLATYLSVGALAAAVGCGDAIQLPTGDDTSIASGLGGGTPTSSSVVGGGSPGQGGQGGETGAGGAEPSVWVGVFANPLHDEAAATRADEVEAVLGTYAVGASVFATKRTWSTADAAGFALDAQLATLGCTDGAACRPVALTIAVVDGRLDGRPASLDGESWGSEASLAAMDDTLDQAFAELGPALRFVAVGARVDVWLDQHPEDRSGLEALLERAIARAQSHPDAREDLMIGVGLSGEGALAATAPATDLRALGNTTMASLFPGLAEVEGSADVPSPGSIALDLDAIDDVDPGRPVALVEVGFPSAEEVGADPDAQGVFYDALFGALESRRASFPLVVASRLHDLGPEACAEEAVALDETDERVLAYRCSTGARDTEGAAKPAWASLVVGAARLATGAVPSGD